jgi:hypothetical protein
MSRNGRDPGDDDSWFPSWSKVLLGLGAAVAGAATVGYAVSKSSSSPQQPPPSPQRPPLPPQPSTQQVTRISNAE